MLEHVQKLKARPLSWSSISSFEYDKKSWAKRYLANVIESPSPELIFGSQTGKKLETDPTFLPQIKRYNKMEYPFNVSLSGIPLTGYADTFCDKSKKKLGEYKTGKNEWTQKRADEHGQITMYLLMNFITHQIPPEKVDVTIYWMPTKANGDFSISFVEPIEENIKVFKTKRTTKDILKFAGHIKDIYKEMEEYALSYE